MAYTSAGIIPKTESETLFCGLNWTNRLTPLGPGVTITASAWETGDAFISIESISFTDVITKVKVQGGYANNDYRLRNIITLSDGEIFEASLTIRVE